MGKKGEKKYASQEKTIRISKDAKHKLEDIKRLEELKSLDEVIQMLLRRHG